MIAMIDYDAGNLKSVEKAFMSLGITPVITRDRELLLQAEKVILPGVGSFGVAMEKLHHYNLVGVIKEITDTGTPLLGICLGMQLLFETSEESMGVKGLSLLQGKIRRIPSKEGLKIPHMGWNSLDINSESTLLKGLHQESYVYFVHSYYLKATDEKMVAAKTDYSTSIHAAVEKDNIYGCQFHPEKSGDVGLKILQNFINLTY